MSDQEELDLTKIINLLDKSITIAIQAREKLSRLQKEHCGEAEVEGG